MGFEYKLEIRLPLSLSLSLSLSPFSRLMLTDGDDSLLSPPSSKRRQLDPPSPLAYSVQSVSDDRY